MDIEPTAAGDQQEVLPGPDMAVEMAAYIQSKFVRRPGIHVLPDTPLVSSGLIDSFALIEIFLKLEQMTNRKIPASKVQAKDMDTVQLMLATANRMGKPRG
jgi:acyl carrier protein